MQQQHFINWLNLRFAQTEGYGRFGLSFIRSLLRLGVHVTPLEKQQLGWPVWLQQVSGLDFSRPTIALMPSYDLQPIAGRVWNFSMYEGTVLGDDWEKPLKHYVERVLVPHEFLVDVFRRRGCRVPIHVIPGGTDPVEFPVSLKSPWEAGKPYTFLALGDRGNRKGWDIAWSAFWKAFGNNPDVRLLVKMKDGARPELSLAHTDRRLSIWREDSNTMLPVYEQADCFVFPTRGEGWGMPPREFAMTGKPVLCTDWSGVTDGLEHWGIPIRVKGLTPALLRSGGEWALPDEDHLVELMRWCYEHRDEARQKGLEAAQWLREHQTWDHAARKLVDLFDEVL